MLDPKYKPPWNSLAGFELGQAWESKGPQRENKLPKIRDFNKEMLAFNKNRQTILK